MNSKKEAILFQLKEKFMYANAQDDLQVFFTDCFDVGKPYDRTVEEVAKMVRLAQDNAYYDTRD